MYQYFIANENNRLIVKGFSFRHWQIQFSFTMDTLTLICGHGRIQEFEKGVWEVPLMTQRRLQSLPPPPTSVGRPHQSSNYWGLLGVPEAGKPSSSPSPPPVLLAPSPLLTPPFPFPFSFPHHHQEFPLGAGRQGLPATAAVRGWSRGGGDPGLFLFYSNWGFQ